MDERRKSTRVGLVSEVRVQKVAPDTPGVMSWGTDLSESGIGLLVNNRLEMGEEIALLIAAPGSQAPISVKGRVVWTQQAKPGFRAGIQLRETEALAQAQVLQLVIEQLACISTQRAAAQSIGASAVPSKPDRPLRVRGWQLAVILAIAALALLLQNTELTRSANELKGRVASLQAKQEQLRTKLSEAEWKVNALETVE